MLPNTNSQLVLRPAQLEDLPAVLGLICLLESDGRVLDAVSAQQIFARFQSYPNYTLYVASIGSEIIGTFALLIMDNLAHLGAPSAILEDMVVKTSYQGKGVGRAMITFALQVCRSAGCYKLVLSSSLRREDAHRFYQKLGFKQYGLCFAVNLEGRALANGAQDD
jgi:GNAT superfamily N-acetyltransferase